MNFSRNAEEDIISPNEPMRTLRQGSEMHPEGVNSGSTILQLSVSHSGVGKLTRRRQTCSWELASNAASPRREDCFTSKLEFASPGCQAVYSGPLWLHSLLPAYLRSVGEATSEYLAPGWRVA